MPPVPSRHRARARSVGLGALALVLLVALMPPPPTDARRPWTPAPPTRAYTPRHVWQTRDNCVFASGQMLLDKWTLGRIRVGQGRLRAGARIDEGGAGFRDLARGVARTTGIRLRWSPAGGDPMTWWQLLDRIERDGGAVLFGEYSRLPAVYTRWAPRFARSRTDHHAVFIERYDRANARVWLMDPLAVGHFPGEWIDVAALRRFARFDGPLVFAAATPARARPTTAPLSDRAYRLGDPVLGPLLVAASETAVNVPLTIADGFPLPAGHRLVGRWERLDDALGELGRDDAVVLPGAPPTASVSISAVQPPGSSETASVEATPSSKGFTFALPTPERPGRYRLALGLVPAGASTDAPARTLPPVEVDVDPPFAGRLAVVAPTTTQVGSAIRVTIDATNMGTVDWRAAPIADVGPGPRVDAVPGRPAALTLRWRAATGDHVTAGEVELALAPGEAARFELDLAVPPTAGAWVLEADVVHPAHGSLVAAGTAAPSAAVSVDPPGSEPLP